MALGRTLLLMKPQMQPVRAHRITVPQSGSHRFCCTQATGLSRTSHVARPVDSHNVPRPIVHSPLQTTPVRFPRGPLLRNRRNSSVLQHEKQRQLPGGGISFSDDLRGRMPPGHPLRVTVSTTVSRRFAFLNARARDITRLNPQSPDDRPLWATSAVLRRYSPAAPGMQHNRQRWS